jgi:hypothetical protein
MKRIVISFDVGIKNLGFCVAIVEAGKFTLVKADKESFDKAPLNSMICPIVAWLRKEFNDIEIEKTSVVLIENQMKARMKVIQTIIGTYFEVATNAIVRFVSASGKLKFAEGSEATKGKSGYALRKAMGIAEVKRLTGGKFVCDYTKEDDICDAVMQAYAFCVSKKWIAETAEIELSLSPTVS